MFWCFDEPLGKRLQKLAQFMKNHDKPSIWPKLATSRANYHVLAFSWTFQKEVAKSASFRKQARKLIDLAKTMQLFRTNDKQWTMNDELFSKRLQKVAQFVKEHEKSSIWPKLYIFSNKLPCFCISINFSGEKCKKCLISWETTTNHRSRQIFATFRTNCHVFAFRWTFQEKVAKSASFRHKAREIIDLAKTLQLFEQTTMCLHFDELFRKKLQQVPHFVRKHDKSSISPNLCNFSNKLPCLCISMNFSGKTCKKCLISWKSRRNHRSGQNFASFRANYHVLAFWWTFQEKKCKKWPVSWKSTNTHRFGQNLQLLEETTMSLHFDEVFRKKFQKVPHFVIKHEKPSIWPKLSTFRANYHYLAFSWTFQQEVAKTTSFPGKAREIMDLAKTMQPFRTNYHVFAFRWSFQEKVPESASFRYKARKTIDLAKTFNFSSKLPCLGIFMNFSARGCKNCLIPWKSTRNHRFGQNYATFSNKLPCLCISINFSGKSCKKCLISWNSTKNHWFGQSFATFGTSYNVFFLLMNFQEKSCKKCVVSWKSTKNHRFCQLATFRENYHVLTFRWTLQQKVTKTCSCREKARKIINLAKTLQLFEQTTMFWHFDEVFSKKFQKVPHFVKKHENSSISRKLATFPTNYHVLTLWWTFQRKVAESASFSEKTLKIIDCAKTCNFFEQSTMFMRFDELFSKRFQKVPRFVKKHEKSSIWPKLCNFSNKLPCFGISMIIAGKSCKKVEKVAHFMKNDEKSSIWPKLATFRGNYHVSAFLSTFQQKVSHFVKKHEKSSFGSCLAHS